MDVPEGNGTGIVWDSRGHVVTNYHVLANVLQVGVGDARGGGGQGTPPALSCRSRGVPCLPVSIVLRATHIMAPALPDLLLAARLPCCPPLAGPGRCCHLHHRQR